MKCLVVERGAEGPGSILNKCGWWEAAEGGASHGYRANLIKGDRPLHMRDLELDTYILRELPAQSSCFELHEWDLWLTLYTLALSLLLWNRPKPCKSNQAEATLDKRHLQRRLFSYLKEHGKDREPKEKRFTFIFSLIDKSWGVLLADSQLSLSAAQGKEGGGVKRPGCKCEITPAVLILI